MLKQKSGSLSPSQKKALLLTGRKAPWSRVIKGMPYSKANSRQLTTIGGKPRFIKSKDALAYVRAFLLQCPVLDPMFECDVTVEIDIYYTSRRPDVDESLILDAMQERIYRNDRQVRRKVITGYIDKDNPRAEITVYPFEG